MGRSEMKAYETGAGYDYLSNPPPSFSMSQKQEPIEFSEKFKVDGKWKDVWAAVLFFISFSGFVYISVKSISYLFQIGILSRHNFYRNDRFSINLNTCILFLLSAGFSVIFSFLYFLLARIYTKQFIWITGILQIVLSLAVSAYYLIKGLYMISILFLILTFFFAFCFYSWRSRIPLATSYLQFAMDISKYYFSVYFVSFCGVIFSLLFFTWFYITVVASSIKFSDYTYNGTKNPECVDNGLGCESKYSLIVMLFLFFNACWITEVIKNVVHTTICGVYGSYYYGFNTPEGIPKHATISSFRRTMTYSFGSICFGSLVASVVQILRDILNAFMYDRSSSGDVIGTIISCFVSCIVTFLDWLVQYFNHYCYAQIALYGKKYLKAARDTWRMFKRSGVDALVNDCLIYNVLSFGVLFVACISAFLCFLYLKITSPQYNSEGSYSLAVIFVSFFISFQVCSTALIVIRSGVSALFVGVSEDREVLRRNFPVLYSQMFGSTII